MSHEVAVVEIVCQAEPTLPEGWSWTTLGEVAFVNRRDATLRELPDNLVVSFVPMAAIDGERGTIAWHEERPLSEVRKGFTSFSNGDVLFAKITPCMENGKAAIANSLMNGRGFGSTESMCSLRETACYPDGFITLSDSSLSGAMQRLALPELPVNSVSRAVFSPIAVSPWPRRQNKNAL